MYFGNVEMLFLKQFVMMITKAAAHVAVDLQCWHCKGLIE